MTRIVLLLALASFSSASAIFIDGDGHYALRPETQTNPGFSEDRGLYQGIFQSFRLLGEARSNDKLSFKLEFRLFEDPRRAYLGDTGRPDHCSPVEDAEETDDDGNTSPNLDDDGNQRKKHSNRGNADDCSGRHQDTNEPAYEPYIPKITEAYVTYGFDFCLLEVGRRGRDWGMGIFLDSGRDPFETGRSVYDGATCKVNIQKTQALGFSVGFDKIAETGTGIDVGLPEGSDKNQYGVSKTSDDLDQLFFTIEYDDRKANAGAAFTRQVGIYFANIFGSERIGDADKKVKTDVKFADLYTAFFFYDFAIRNEVIFRLGKSGDPNWARYGGVSAEEDNTDKSNVNAMGFAGDFTWTMSHSGSRIGPREYNQGNASAHDLILEYAYAPGDRDGYFPEYTHRAEDEPPIKRSGVGKDKDAAAMAFHRNYKPALILFNANPELDDTRVDGIFDPDRVMNAIVLATAYRYSSLAYGNFEVKFISAELVKGMPDAVKADIHRKEEEAIANDERPERRPVGYSGRHLGYELDLKYQKYIGKDLFLGTAAAFALPGAAWKTSRKSPAMSYLLQGSVGFVF